jgi:hypothetical protein
MFITVGGSSPEKRAFSSKNSILRNNSNVKIDSDRILPIRDSGRKQISGNNLPGGTGISYPGLGKN